MPYSPNGWDWSPVPSRARSPAPTNSISPMDLTLVQAAGMVGHRVNLPVQFPFSPPRELSPDPLPMSVSIHLGDPLVSQQHNNNNMMSSYDDYSNGCPMYLWATPGRYRLHGGSEILDASTRVGSSSPIYQAQSHNPETWPTNNTPYETLPGTQGYLSSDSQASSSNCHTPSSDSQPYLSVDSQLQSQEGFELPDDTHYAYRVNPTTPSSDIEQASLDSQRSTPYTHSAVINTTRRNNKRDFSTFQKGQGTALSSAQTSFTKNEYTDLDDYVSPRPASEYGHQTQHPHTPSDIDNTYREPSLHQDQPFPTCNQDEHPEIKGDNSAHVSTKPTHKRPVAPNTAIAGKGSRRGSQTGKTADGIDVTHDENPYAQLIYVALMSVPSKTMHLSEIYQFFRDNFPRFAKMRTKGWQNSVRHNLSMNGAFLKIERPPSSDGTKQRGFLWALSPEAELEGVKSTTRFRKSSGNSPAAKKVKIDHHNTPLRRTRATRSSGRGRAQNASKKTSSTKARTTGTFAKLEVGSPAPSAQLVHETNLPQAGYQPKKLQKTPIVDTEEHLSHNRPTNDHESVHDDNPNPRFDAEFDMIKREGRVLWPEDQHPTKSSHML